MAVSATTADMASGTKHLHLYTSCLFGGQYLQIKFSQLFQPSRQLTFWLMEILQPDQRSMVSAEEELSIVAQGTDGNAG